MPRPYLKRLYDRFLKLRGKPREIALGFALGLFIAFSPTMGIQIAIAVFLASIFKWSKISAALAVQITNPLTAPFIYGLTYRLGAQFLGLENSFKLGDQIRLETILEMFGRAPGIFGAMTLGGILVGLPAAGAGYFIAYGIIRRYRTRQSIAKASKGSGDSEP